MTSALPRLTSRQHPIVRACRDARDGRTDGRVLLDGARLLRDALDAGVAIDVVLMSHDVMSSGDGRALIDRLAGSDAAVYDATPPVLELASPVRTTTGIVAIARWRPAELAAVFAPTPALALGLAGVQDPGNVGSVTRSADALGATGVAVLGESAHPGGWKALRGAMGSTFRLPVAHDAIEAGLAAARRHDAAIVATDAAHGTPLDEVDLARPVFVLLGHEGQGLAPALVERADARVRIPMRAGVNSLNVGVTAALLLYEARRQRASRQMSRPPSRRSAGQVTGR